MLKFFLCVTRGALMGTVVSVCGLPGSGKSTLLRALARELCVRTVEEEPANFPLLPFTANASFDLAFLNHADFLIAKIADAMVADLLPEPTLVEVDWVACHQQWTSALFECGELDAQGAALCREIFLSAVRAGVPFPANRIVIDIAPEEARRRGVERQSPSRPALELELLDALDRHGRSSAMPVSAMRELRVDGGLGEADVLRVARTVVEQALRR